MRRAQPAWLFALLAASNAFALEAGPPVVVSRTWTGALGVGICFSPNFARGTARFLTFACQGRLTPDDNNDRADTFLLDRLTGQLERASVTSDETEVRFNSSLGLPSDDGQSVVLQSDGPLHPDAIGPFGWLSLQVFFRDRGAGETMLISRNALGQYPFYSVQFEDAEFDRSEVLLSTTAPLFMPMANPPLPSTHAYVRNWQTGTIELISQRADGGYPNNSSFAERLLPGGRYVLFRSSAADLPGAPASGTHLYLRDRFAATTLRLTRPPGGGEFSQPLILDIYRPRITPDLRYVVLASNSRELAPVDPGIDPLQLQVYVLDRSSGQYQRLSANANGEPGNAYSGVVDISDDGRYVAFYSRATNLQAGQSALYVVDRNTGAQVNVAAPLGANISSTPDLSLARDGSAIAFSWRSANPNLPGQFDRLLMYTVELRGTQPPPAPAATAVPAGRRGTWLALAVLVLLIARIRIHRKARRTR